MIEYVWARCGKCGQVWRAIELPATNADVCTALREPCLCCGEPRPYVTLPPLTKLGDG